MKEVRAFPVKKYMEFTVDESLIENKFKFLNVPKQYKSLGLDLSSDANLFYGLEANGKQYKSISNMKEFDNYDVILRLLSWSWFNEKGDFVFRVLKSNKDEQVDFTEEKEYLKCCFIKIT